MVVDIRAVLHRVVDEVFGDSVFVPKYDDHDAPDAYRVRVTSRAVPYIRERRGCLVASDEWFQAHIPDLDVGNIRFNYDDDEQEKEADLRDLALLVRAYLRGAGEVTYRPSLIRRRPIPTLTVEANGARWTLGRRASSEARI